MAPIERPETFSPVTRRSRITHNGIEATSRAARPEGTVFSATEITAFAPGSISPTKPAESSSARVGRIAARPLRQAMNGSRISPTATKRKPAPSSGGIVSTISAMARYVEPQTM